ncbi:MAG: enoyl-CoA hydratase-related protein [Actinomycetota bacterium]|nr:enoyl-CoA hydratase-related protein [Actinomycetota bacterium]
MAGSVDITIDDSIASVLLNNPARRNAMTRSMWKELADAFTYLRDVRDIRAAIISGVEGNFAAGADISEFKEVRQSGQSAIEYDENTEAALAAIESVPFATIASIDGFCIGGGISIASACDIRVSSESAKFRLPPARLAISYPFDSLVRMVRIIGVANCKRMLLTADVLSAQSMGQLGFVEVVIEDVAAAALGMAKRIADNAPLSIHATKDILSAIEGEASNSARVASNRQREVTLSSHDYAEALAAFIEKREPRFRGN